MARNGHGITASLHQPDQAGANPDQWVGGSGASGNGDWNTAADWSTGVPAASATATFATSDSGYTVTGDATIGGIVVDGDGVTFDGALTQNGNGPTNFLTGLDGADVTLDANAFVTGGALNFANGTFLEVQGVLISTGGTADAMQVDGLNGQAIISGTLQVNQLYVQDGAGFTGDVALTDGGNVTIDTSSTFSGDTLSLLGSGTLYEAQAPGGASGVGSVTDAINFSASGGVLTLASDPTAELNVSGAITGSGSVLANGGTVDLTGALNYTGITEVQDGTLNISQVVGVLARPVFVTDGALTFGPDTVSVTLGGSGVGSGVAIAGGNAGSGVTVTGFTPIILPADTVVAGGGSDTISAGGANVLAFASGGALTFLGGTNGSTVVGGSGTMNITGGAGTDVVFGGAGAVTYLGGAGHDTVVAGSGALTATGGSGADLIFGGSSGQDVLNTGAGNSTIVGAAGAQLFANGAGNAAVVAGAASTIDATAATGNDTLFAGGANDTILGGAAGLQTDVLGSGAAMIKAGAGIADIFGHGGSVLLDLSSGQAGTINIAGVSLSQLNIDLTGYSAGEAAHDLATATVAGGNTYIVLSDNTHLNLFGITGLTVQNFS